MSGREGIRFIFTIMILAVIGACSYFVWWSHVASTVQASTQSEFWPLDAESISSYAPVYCHVARSSLDQSYIADVYMRGSAMRLDAHGYGRGGEYGAHMVTLDKKTYHVWNEGDKYSKTLLASDIQSGRSEYLENKVTCSPWFGVNFSTFKPIPTEDDNNYTAVMDS